MLSNRGKGDHLTMDETSCGPMCQHPACWQSNTRREKGFPKMVHQVHPAPDIDLDLPSVKVWNLLDDYGEDPNDKYPAKYAGKPQHERSNLMLTDLKHPVRTNSIKVTRVPQTSPKSSNGQSQTGKPGPAFKFVEVQEVFDPEDLQATWDATFLPKKYYVWVPNKKKKKRRKKTVTSLDSCSLPKSGVKYVKSKDVTEDMVPQDIETDRILAKKKRAQLTKSPTYRQYPITPRTTRTPTRMDYDPEGITELLDLPRDVLVQVLDHTKQSDLMSREKIREIIQRFMPQTMDRGTTNMSLTSTDLLQPKKLSLHEGNKNLRQPHLMETKPVFYLDDDVVDEASQEDYDSEAYGSLKDLYFGGPAPAASDLRKYKNPLPSITGGGQSRSISAGDGGLSKIPSISLGLPELPSGIRQTRPFTYSKKIEYDFTLEPAPRFQFIRRFSRLSRITSSGEGYVPTITPSMNLVTYNTQTPPVSRETQALSDTTRRPSTFNEEGSITIPHGEMVATDTLSEDDEKWLRKKHAPVPTPPTSVHSTETPASDHGTTIRVNVPSDTTARSEAGSSVKDTPRQIDKEPSQQQQVSRELSPLHAVSPTFSTRVPKAPATTPAYHPSPMKSPRSAPLARDVSGSTMTATPQEWPPVEKAGSPVHIRAPVNTPGSTQDLGLGTIKETGREYADQPLPMSRGGRSVRFEIPEVPPPPSSPQESDKDSLVGVRVEGEQSRNTVTVNTVIPKDTPSVSNKPTSGITTIHTDQNTFNTSANTRENSDVKSAGKSQTGSRVRELSMVSSPEPWPQVIEADFDITPNPKSDSTLHMAPQQPEGGSSADGSDKERNQSANAEIKVEIVVRTPETPKSDFVNKDTEPVSKVKKIMAESRKTDSPAPPPPSPEGKEDIAKGRNGMAPIEEHSRKSNVEDDESIMTVMQILPKGITRKSKVRQIDTFVNIDIPATSTSEPSQSEAVNNGGTIIEESEQEVEEMNKRDMALSVQSTLANRTISEAYSDATSSMIEPAVSQASQGPALSEDFSEKQEKPDQLFGDWSGIAKESSDADTQAMLSSDKQELDMTEDGGDHEGFKEDLKQEYEKLLKETEGSEDRDNEDNDN